MHQLELLQFCCLRLGPAGRAREWGPAGPGGGAGVIMFASYVIM